MSIRSASRVFLFFEEPPPYYVLPNNIPSIASQSSLCFLSCIQNLKWYTFQSKISWMAGPRMRERLNTWSLSSLMDSGSQPHPPCPSSGQSRACLKGNKRYLQIDDHETCQNNNIYLPDEFCKHWSPCQVQMFVLGWLLLVALLPSPLTAKSRSSRG